MQILRRQLTSCLLRIYTVCIAMCLSTGLKGLKGRDTLFGEATLSKLLLLPSVKGSLGADCFLLE